MKAVILCGGQGTRIRDVSEVVPKPMLKIGEMPILWHVMKIYAAHGVNEFVLCLGYKGWLIKEFFLNYRAMSGDCTVDLGESSIEFHSPSGEDDWRVTLAETGMESGTGARVWRVRHYLEDRCDAFCLTYGDGVADVDISALIDQHERSGLVGTITAVRLAGRFGELRTVGERVVAFDEKPARTAGMVNGGFMVFDAKRVWDYFRDGEDLVLEREPLERMVADENLGVFQHKGYWQCMDTPREYDMLNHVWAMGSAPWKIW